jgi:lipoprotein-releasing system ATP-binding protein
MEGLVLKNIHKTFTSGQKKIEVLKGLEMVVKKGDMVSVVGESGVGKTTLLHIIGSIESANRGDIIVDGKNIISLNDRELDSFRNRDVGFVFQFFHLLPEFNVIENTIMPLLISGVPKDEAKDKAMDLLTRVGLADRIDHYPAQLSGGEQQRVAAARALITSPKLVLADEPTGNLDPRTGREIADLLVDLHRSGDRITIVATHNTEIAKMCDKIYTLKRGKLEG